MAAYIIVAVIAYLIGSISFSVIISKKVAGFDVREKGSKNAGATNVLRTVGKKAGAMTLLCDLLKGVVAMLVAMLIGNIAKNSDATLIMQIAGIAVVLGHTFPLFFGFKGGKGVATTLGVLLVVNWQIALIALVFAIVVIAITKMVSLGSISAAILVPILALFLQSNYFIFALILALFIVYNHRTNIKRIAEGKENKLGSKKENK